jgi:methionyl-tRNA formyltransferase
MTNSHKALRVVLMTHFTDLLIDPILKSPHQLVGVIECGHQKTGRIKNVLRLIYKLFTTGKIPQNTEKFFHNNGIAYRAETNRLSNDLALWLDKLSADVMVLYSAPLIPEELIDLTRLGCLNIHPSLLPKYRGPRPIIWMAKNYDLEGGATVFFVDKHSDTGPIVEQKSLNLTAGNSHHQTGQELLFKCGIPALLESLDLVASDKHQLQNQTKQSPTEYARRCTDQEYWDFIDWENWTLPHVWHYMSCIPFWNNKLQTLNGWKKFLDWEINHYKQTDNQPYPPGQLISENKELYFSHKDGIITLKPIMNPIKIVKKLLTKQANLPAPESNTDLQPIVKIGRPKTSELGKLFFAAIKALPTTIDCKLARYLITAHHHECFVVYENDKIVGFCFYGLHPDRKTLWYNYAGTDPDCRSRGYGSLMMQYMEQFAVENGYNKTGIIILLYKATNVGAQKFFSREGYKKHLIKDKTDSLNYIKTFESSSSEIKIKPEKKSIFSKTFYLAILAVEIIALISTK